MRCPDCDKVTRNRNFKGKCLHCDYEYAFKADDRYKDRFYQACIRKASQNNTVYFTENQAFAAHYRIIKSKNLLPVALMFMFGGFFALIAVSLSYVQGELNYLFFGISFVVFLVFSIGISSPQTISTFKGNLNRYLQKKPTDKLISGRSLEDPPPSFQEGDLFQYGVTKVLVVDNNEVVDLLVKNQFFAKEQTIVVSTDFYPSYLFPKLREILANDPDIKVYCLHGVDLNKESYAKDVIQTAAMLLRIEDHRIIDLGLTRTYIRKEKKFAFPLKSSSMHVIPVDLMTYGHLAALLAVALEMVIPLAQVAQTSPSDGRGYG